MMLEESESIHNCKTTCKFFRDGLIFLITVGPHGIADLLPKRMTSLLRHHLELCLSGNSLLWNDLDILLGLSTVGFAVQCQRRSP